MKRTIHATINFTIDENHPDRKYVKDIKKPMTFSDVYNIDMNYFNNDKELIRNYIKNDLALVAGGGYNTDHIHNVSYEIAL